MRRPTLLGSALLLPLALALAACGGGATASPAAPTIGPTPTAAPPTD